MKLLRTRIMYINASKHLTTFTFYGRKKCLRYSRATSAYVGGKV